MGGRDTDVLATIYAIYHSIGEFLNALDEVEAKARKSNVAKVKLHPQLNLFYELREIISSINDERYPQYKDELCQILDFLERLFTNDTKNSTEVEELTKLIQNIVNDVETEIKNNPTIDTLEINDCTSIVGKSPSSSPAVAPAVVAVAAPAASTPALTRKGNRKFGNVSDEPTSPIYTVTTLLPTNSGSSPVVMVREIDEDPLKRTNLVSSIVEENITPAAPSQRENMPEIQLNDEGKPAEYQPSSKLLVTYKNAIDSIQADEKLKKQLLAVYQKACAEENENKSLPSAVKSILNDLTEVAKCMGGNNPAPQPLLDRLIAGYGTLENKVINPKLRTAIAVAIGAVIGAAIGFTIGLFLGGVTSIPMMFAGATLGMSIATIGAASLITATIAGLCTFKASTSYQAYQKAAKTYEVSARLNEIKSPKNQG